jgi:cytochrome c553
MPLYTLSEADIKAGYWIHEPRPVLPHPRGTVIVSRTDLKKSTGRLILANVLEGRNMVGVKPGEIRKLLVLEALPKPINFTGGMDPLSYGGSFTLERVVGTVPVEADGSAYFELPALRSFFFVAVDEKDLSVKRMQSFLTVQPGEVGSCVGCHEQRTRTTQPPGGLLALTPPASTITPIPDVPEVFDFPRDIQPILDNACVSCHGYEKTDRGGPRAGGLVLTGDRGPMFSHGYFMLTITGLFSDGRKETEGVVQRIPGHNRKTPATITDQLVAKSWPRFLHPWPLGENYLLVSCQPAPDAPWGIHLVDTFDNRILIAEEEGQAFLEPIPMQPRPVPPSIPDRVKPERKNATVYLTDIYTGGNMAGVPKGTVKSLRVFDPHYAYPGMGGHKEVGVDGPWDVKRIHGTVPVAEDGSASFTVPANTPLALQPLDADGRALQVMRSWFTTMPGESAGCIGCHESPGTAGPNRVSQQSSPRHNWTVGRSMPQEPPGSNRKPPPSSAWRPPEPLISVTAKNSTSCSFLPVLS